MTETHVPAVAYAVVRDNSERMGAFGVLERAAPQRPANERSVFHLASLAKPFVAAAVMQLVERGSIRLDAPVVQYLPYFKVDDPRHRDITVRSLLLHTSGLPDVSDYGWDRPEYDAGALERYVRSLSNVKLLTAPGTTVAYSNMGYDILGDVIAKPFMVEGGKAISTRYFPYNRSHAPSSTLYSNSVDMLRWLKLFLGKTSGTAVPLSRKAIAQMLEDEAQRNIHHDEQIRPGQGIGWSSLTIDGVRLNGHGGHDNGFRSVAMFSVGERAGVVLMTNGDSDDIDLDGVGLKILGRLIGKDWSRFARTRQGLNSKN